MGKRILLVEDDMAIMETLSLFLRYEGYEVLKARSVEQAAPFIQNDRPDLVLLDYMLQDDTAEPVARMLREEHGDEVGVILFTAADDPIGKANSIDADAVVAKPFELDYLLQTICECLNRPRVSGEAQVLPRRLPESPRYLASR